MLRVIGGTAVDDNPPDPVPARLAFAAHRATGAAPESVLSFPEPASVDVEVFDVAGRRVAHLAQGLEQAGEHAYAWQGCGAGGGRLASGFYIARARLVIGGRTVSLVTRAVLIR